jgi:hypothetical protein
MKNTKLSLADFKAKAETTNGKELLNNIQGGKWKDCHGFTGGLGKYVRGEADSIKWTVGG